MTHLDNNQHELPETIKVTLPLQHEVFAQALIVEGVKIDFSTFPSKAKGGVTPFSILLMVFGGRVGQSLGTALAVVEYPISSFFAKVHNITRPNKPISDRFTLSPTDNQFIIRLTDKQNGDRYTIEHRYNIQKCLGFLMKPEVENV